MECREKVGGRDVRGAIFRLCEEAHQECSSGARRILQVHAELQDTEKTVQRLYQTLEQETPDAGAGALMSSE
jgi:hypothetical protein